MVNMRNTLLIKWFFDRGLNLQEATLPLKTAATSLMCSHSQTSAVGGTAYIWSMGKV